MGQSDFSRRWFFPGMALLLIAIVAVGFSPTFFLRSVLGTEHFPAGLRTGRTSAMAVGSPGQAFIKAIT